MSFGVFEMDNGDAPQLLLKPGVYFQENSAFETLDTAQILEHVTHSWYAQSGGPANLAGWDTQPVNPKPNAYSWLKAPRYKGRSFECGSLARMWMHGDYRGGISVMDRHIARAMESRKIALAMKDWLDQLVVGQSGYILPALPEAASAAGLTEAPRGALGHWISIENNVISKYQVITPTCWNLSPRDDADNRGPLEQALIGAPVLNPDKPIEVLRVIHSYDPCLDCATHVLRIKK
jgi:hydrogenase large subunit